MALRLTRRARTAINWGVTAPPETFIIAGDGTVRSAMRALCGGATMNNASLPALARPRSELKRPLPMGVNPREGTVISAQWVLGRARAFDPDVSPTDQTLIHLSDEESPCPDHAN